MPQPEQTVRKSWAAAINDTASAMHDWVNSGCSAKPMDLPSRMKPLILQTRGVLEDAIEYERKRRERAAARQERKAAEQRAREREERDDPGPSVEPLAIPPDDVEQTAPEVAEPAEPAECREHSEDTPLPPEAEVIPESRTPPRRPQSYVFTSRF